MSQPKESSSDEIQSNGRQVFSTDKKLLKGTTLPQNGIDHEQRIADETTRELKRREKITKKKKNRSRLPWILGGGALALGVVLIGVRGATRKNALVTENLSLTATAAVIIKPRLSPSPISSLIPTIKPTARVIAAAPSPTETRTPRPTAEVPTATPRLPTATIYKPEKITVTCSDGRIIEITVGVTDSARCPELPPPPRVVPAPIAPAPQPQVREIIITATPILLPEVPVATSTPEPPPDLSKVTLTGCNDLNGNGAGEEINDIPSGIGGIAVSKDGSFTDALIKPIDLTTNKPNLYFAHTEVAEDGSEVNIEESFDPGDISLMFNSSSQQENWYGPIQRKIEACSQPASAEEQQQPTPVPQPVVAQEVARPVSTSTPQPMRSCSLNPHEVSLKEGHYVPSVEEMMVDGKNAVNKYTLADCFHDFANYLSQPGLATDKTLILRFKSAQPTDSDEVLYPLYVKYQSFQKPS